MPSSRPLISHESPLLFHIQRCIPKSCRKKPSTPPPPPPTPNPWEKERRRGEAPTYLLLPLENSIKSLSFHGRLSEAFSAFSLLRFHSPSSFHPGPISSLLSCCTAQRAAPQGKQLHAHVISLGLAQAHCLVSKLTTFYATFDLSDARDVVESSGKIPPLPWNLLISAYVRNGLWQDAILAYKKMTGRGVRVDKYTYPSVLKACGEILDLGFGMEVHRCMDESGLEWDLHVSNALVAMYAKCGALDVAKKLFDGMGERDVVTWNSMISGYVSKGMWDEAFEMLRQMPEASEINTVTWNTVVGGNLRMGNYMEALRLISQMSVSGAAKDYVTLVIGLKVCSRAEFLRTGKEIHGLAIRISCDQVENVRNALVTMYSRCKNISYAYTLFRIGGIQTLVTWNAMIAGFAHADKAQEACLLFREMVGLGVQPNYVTVTTMLSLSAHTANLRLGQELHSYIMKQGFMDCQLLWNSLLDMYSKSGRMSLAERVFGMMGDHDQISYTSLIAGYGMQGEGITSLELFNKMIARGIEPDGITMVAVLSACSHSGLVAEGQMLFDRMIGLYGIAPQVEHFSCMVDLYGRAGLLKKAEEVIDCMPLQPSTAMLATLVRACRVHRNTEIGQRAARKLLEMKSDNPSHYTVIANFYASAGCWQELARLRTLMRALDIRTPWVYSENEAYQCMVVGQSDPRAHDACVLLCGLADHSQGDAGYVSNEELWFKEGVG